MINVFIVGIGGKMGGMLCECAADFPDITVSGGLDVLPRQGFPAFKRASDVNVPVDVIIDFSRPETLDEVIALTDRYGCSVILATTGYDQSQLKKIDELASRRPVLRTGNMSLGVTLLCELVKTAARVLGPDFDVEIVEKHHNQKVDAPSGTALMLAAAAQEGVGRAGNLVEGRSGKNCGRVKGDIGISAVRGGSIVGQHDVMFIGGEEIITLSHTAVSRKLFATGALRAALFLSRQKCGLYDMKDVVDD